MAIMERPSSPASRSSSPASSDASHEPAAIQKPVAERRDSSIPSAPARSSPDPLASIHDAPSAVTCEWDDCGQHFADIEGLVQHLLGGHIGVHKSTYICQWASCPRRGLVQTSRFALVSHCRSHTGEKPFMCSFPECYKSFTRSDTLAKHLRQQHNISPPAPARGGYRKRKRSMTPPAAPPPAPVPVPVPERHASISPPPPPPPRMPYPDSAHAPSHYNFANRTYAQHQDARDSGFNTFRVNPTVHDRPAIAVSSTMKLRTGADGALELPPREGYMRDGEGGSSSSGDEESGKPYNAEAMGGRSKTMVKYLIMKAKYRYAMAENGLWNDELEMLKRQEREEWREKEDGVDRVLRGFGPQSELLIHEPDIPTNGKHRRPPVSPPPEPHHHPMELPLSRHDHRMELDAR